VAVALLEPNGGLTESSPDYLDIDFFWFLSADQVDLEAKTITKRISTLSEKGFTYVLVAKLKSEKPSRLQTTAVL
jgi:hypothetical protein